MLRESGLAVEHAETLYGLLINPLNWTPFDVRPAFASIGAAEFVGEFVLSFEVGEVRPDPAIFETALNRPGVNAAVALMIGDSDEAGGGARALSYRGTTSRSEG